MRFGVDRPQSSDEVPDYVLAPFKESPEQVDLHIGEAVAKIGKLVD